MRVLESVPIVSNCQSPSELAVHTKNTSRWWSMPAHGAPPLPSKRDAVEMLESKGRVPAPAIASGVEQELFTGGGGVVNGRSRDTALYSMIDEEWPMLCAGFEAWLSPANSQDDRTQVRSLLACRDLSDHALVPLDRDPVGGARLRVPW